MRIAEFIGSVEAEEVTATSVIIGGKKEQEEIPATKNGGDCINGTVESCTHSENRGSCMNVKNTCDDSKNHGNCNNGSDS